jgi:hypothetical protein
MDMAFNDDDGYVKRVWLTPEFIKMYEPPKEGVEGLTKNRRLNQKRAKSIFIAMESGRFRSPADMLCIGKLGYWLNGQHRCAAIKMLNKPYPLWVHFNVDEAQFSSIDIGQKRSTAQSTGIPTNIVAIISWIMDYARNGTGSKDNEDVKAMHKFIVPHLEHMCGINRKFYSSAPVAGASVTAIDSGEPPEYVSGLYNGLVKSEGVLSLTELPNVAEAFIKLGRLNSGKNWEDRINAFEQAMYMFTASNQDHKSIKITPEFQLSCSLKAQSICRRAIPAWAAEYIK